MIRNHFQMLLPILRDMSEWDIMYYLESLDTPQEAFTFVKELRDKLLEASERAFTSEMKKHLYSDKEDLINQFVFITEKQRGYPLWMWEMWDVEEWASAWAEDNWYWHLFLDED